MQGWINKLFNIVHRLKNPQGFKTKLWIMLFLHRLKIPQGFKTKIWIMLFLTLKTDYYAH